MPVFISDKRTMQLRPSRLVKVRAHANTKTQKVLYGMLLGIGSRRVSPIIWTFAAARFLGAVLSPRKQLDAFVDTKFSDYGYVYTHTRTHEQLPSDLCALSALTN